MTTRATRLLHLLDDLRRRRRPVRGAQLADQLGISLRTLYRDIDALRAQGAVIAGDPGVGYQLRAGFMLPPMMRAEGVNSGGRRDGGRAHGKRRSGRSRGEPGRSWPLGRTSMCALATADIHVRCHDPPDPPRLRAARGSSLLRDESRRLWQAPRRR